MKGRKNEIIERCKQVLKTEKVLLEKEKVLAKVCNSDTSMCFISFYEYISSVIIVKK